MTDGINTRDLFGEIVRPDPRGILKDKFIMPPFSVLNAREGDWQERKRKWLALGIKSELGRGNALPNAGGGKHDECEQPRDADGRRIPRSARLTWGTRIHPYDGGRT